MRKEYIKLIKNKVFINKDNNLVLKNSFALMILQIANFLIPLINLPYLLTVLGPENYGLVTFALSFVAFFLIITDYGFSFSATREIATAKSSYERNKIFTSVMICKLILSITSFIIGLILLFSIPSFKQDYLVYLICLFNVVSSLLNSNWLFQGMQRMKYITIINVSSRTFMMLSIFLIVKNNTDYYKYAIIYVSTSILIGIIGQLIARYTFKIRLVQVKWSSVLDQFHKGKHVFLTTFMSSVMSNTGIFILGIMSSKEAVAYFSAADKLIKALKMLFSPITQALFPQVSQKFDVSFEVGYNYILKSFKVIIGPLILICAGVALFSEHIFQILYDSRYLPYSSLLALMCVWAFFTIVNNFLGIQTLVGSGHGKEYSVSFFIAAAVTIGSYLLLTQNFSSYGVVLGMIIGETVLTVFLAINVFKIRMNIPQIST